MPYFIWGIICAAVVFVLSVAVLIIDRFNTRAIRAKLTSNDKKNVDGVDNLGVNQISKHCDLFKENYLSFMFSIFETMIILQGQINLVDNQTNYIVTPTWVLTLDTEEP